MHCSHDELQIHAPHLGSFKRSFQGGTCCGADVFLLINWIRSKKEREKNLNPSHQIVCFSFQLPCQLIWNLAIEATGIVVQAAVCGYLLSSTFARKSPCNV